MAKFFANLPAILEQFNPESIPLNWYTNPYGEDDDYDDDDYGYDDDEELHSTDDLPIIMGCHPDLGALLPSGIDDSPTNVYEFNWYKHGKLSRDENKPSVIRVTPALYSTLDENGDLHSYNGMPASFGVIGNGDTYLLDWYEHGKMHRNNDLPGSMTFNAEGVVVFESYWSHGNAHRSNGLPCEVTADSETWMVQGIMHNPQGYADAMYNISLYNWALYGVKFSEEAFIEIKTLSDTTNMPIWAAFLYSFEIITQAHLDVFMNSSRKWETEVPTSWILNCWNVTENMFDGKIEELRISGNATARWFDLNQNEIFFTTFMRVLQSEENDAMLRAAQLKESYV